MQHKECYRLRTISEAEIEKGRNRKTQTFPQLYFQGNPQQEVDGILSLFSGDEEEDVNGSVLSKEYYWRDSTTPVFPTLPSPGLSALENSPQSSNELNDSSTHLINDLCTYPQRQLMSFLVSYADEESDEEDVRQWKSEPGLNHPEKRRKRKDRKTQGFEGLVFLCGMLAIGIMCAVWGMRQFTPIR